MMEPSSLEKELSSMYVILNGNLSARSCSGGKVSEEELEALQDSPEDDTIFNDIEPSFWCMGCMKDEAPHLLLNLIILRLLA